jgi:16S rRNA C1402 (ribose-2'-O) methylase RsmI
MLMAGGNSDGLAARSRSTVVIDTPRRLASQLEDLSEWGGDSMMPSREYGKIPY